MILVLMFLEALPVSFFQEICRVKCPSRKKQADTFFLKWFAMNGFKMFAFHVTKLEMLIKLMENLPFREHLY